MPDGWAPDIATRRVRQFKDLEQEERLLRIATSRALADHIRSYRGDPWLNASEEKFLASVEGQLRRYKFTIEASPKQLAVVWEIIDRADARAVDPPAEFEDVL
jgi:hypothetical protein